MNDIIVFSDGSTLNNQHKEKRRGGVGVFFSDNDKRNLSLSLKETKNYKVTNNVAELLGAINAIEIVLGTQEIKNNKIIIYTDSMYVINIVNKWAKNWQKNNWKKSNNKPVDNIELVKKLYNYSLNININFIHSRGHAKQPPKNDPKFNIWYGNMMADKLAVRASNESD